MRKKTFKIKNNGGFSLIEMLVAITVLSFALIALHALKGTAIDLTSRARASQSLAFLAEKKYYEFEIELKKDIAKNKNFPDEFQDSGRFEKPYEDFFWQIQLNKIELPMPEIDGFAQQRAVIQKVIDQVSNSIRELKVQIYHKKMPDSDGKKADFEIVTHRIVK